jgi:MFS family permease
VYYAPSLFEQLGLDYEMQLTLSGVLNIAQLIAVGVTLLVLDRVGRRPVLLVGSVCLVVSHSVVAAMIGMFTSVLCIRPAEIIIGAYSYDWAANETQAWIGVGFIFVVMLSYGISWGPIPWVMRESLQMQELIARDST